MRTEVGMTGWAGLAWDVVGMGREDRGGKDYNWR